MSQAEKLWNALADGKPHRTDELLKTVYGDDHLGLARLGARVYDIQKKHPEVEIVGWHDPINARLYFYQMKHKS